MYSVACKEFCYSRSEIYRWTEPDIKVSLNFRAHMVADIEAMVTATFRARKLSDAFFQDTQRGVPYPRTSRAMSVAAGLLKTWMGLAHGTCFH